MAGLQLSGLASGFDWKSVVDQLIAVERVPQDKLRTQKTTNTNKLSAFSTLRTKLTALQDAVVALKADNLFGQRTTAGYCNHCGVYVADKPEERTTWAHYGRCQACTETLFL